MISAVTIVGAVLAWVTQKVSPPDISTLDTLYLGSTSLLGFLCVIVAIDARLEVAMFKCVSYLWKTKSSVWEVDHQAFLEVIYGPNKKGSLTSREVVFVILAGLAAAWPAILAVVAFHANKVSLVSAVHIGAAVVFSAVLFYAAPVIARRRKMEI